MSEVSLVRRWKELEINVGWFSKEKAVSLDSDAIDTIEVFPYPLEGGTLHAVDLRISSKDGILFETTDNVRETLETLGNVIDLSAQFVVEKPYERLLLGGYDPIGWQPSQEAPKVISAADYLKSTL